MIVPDASLIAKLVIVEKDAEQAEKLVLKWLERREKLAIVDIVLAEVANALWKHHSMHRDLSLEDLKEAVKRLAAVLEQANPLSYKPATL